MNTNIIKPSSREEWLEVRKSGIGSSEVATILGLNPYETPYLLWRRKIGMDAQKNETFAMKAGHYLEDAVSRFWSDETGREVIKSSAGDWIIRDADKPFLQVSPDRTFWLGASRSPSAKGILECKTTQRQIDAEDVPGYWFCQVQYQLGVARLESGSLAWLSAGREFGYKDITFDPDFYDWMVEEVERFWVDNIIGGIEPEATDVADVVKKYAVHTNGKTVEASDEVFQAWTQLKAVREGLESLATRKEELENKIKLAFGDAEALTRQGITIATWKAPKPSRKFDAKAFEQAHPALAKEFTFEAQGSRRLLIK